MKILSWLIGPLVAARELLVVTVATEKTDGYLRWEESVVHNKLKYKTIGLGSEWLGGDVANGPGGGHKINLMKDELAEFARRSDLYLLFTDAYDVIISGTEDELFNKYDSIAEKYNFETNVIISAEDLIWPDRSLEPKYPMSLGKRFLCSGAIMARADVLLDLLSFRGLKDKDDDQLFYTEAYLDEKLRKKFGIVLDHKAELFFNLNGALEEVEIEFSRTITGENRVKNSKYNTKPLVIHGNGPSKAELNRISNYIPFGWRPDWGCPACMANVVREDRPEIVIAVIVDGVIPFVHNALKRISSLNYPHEKSNLYIYSSTVWADNRIQTFIDTLTGGYASVKFIPSTEGIDNAMARKMALQHTADLKAEYVLFVDGNVQLTNPDVITELMATGKELVAPAISRYGKLWSNYWGAISSDGYYARADDYIEIVEGRRIGVWNMPFINGMYLIRKELAADLLDMFEQSPWSSNLYDDDMNFAYNMRTVGIFMFVTNEQYWGRLVDLDHLPEDRLHPELWQPEHNRPDWEDDYLDQDYWDKIQPDSILSEPCPSVVAFPFLTSKGGFDMIEEMEHYGKWSGGNDAYDDNRLNGGYENVPTVDIHMNQIGLHDEWLYVVRTYAAPMVAKFFTGYQPESKPNLMFVVRYKPGEQDRLRPHHDSSTWTFQIALNRPTIDFEGGGTYFTRYQCSVVGSKIEEDSREFEVKQGMGFAFPGRLTHQHSGLPTTKGTRYILVNFMDS